MKDFLHTSSEEVPPPLIPHGDIALQRIFKHVSAMVDTTNPNNLEEVQVVGLNLGIGHLVTIVNHILETLGTECIHFPWLVKKLKTSTSEHLAKNLESQSTFILAATTRVWTNILANLRQEFKAHIDAFFACTLFCLTPQ